MIQSYFQLTTDQHGQDIHIHLRGVFDGSSAFELLDVIAKQADQGQILFINTNRIVRAYPFGRVILNWNLPQNGLRSKLYFTGPHARTLLPDGCILLSGKSAPTHTCRGNSKNCTCECGWMETSREGQHYA